MIILVTGKSGAGKTTFINFLQQVLAEYRLSATHLNSDLLADATMSKYQEGNHMADYTASELDQLYKGMYFVADKIKAATAEHILIIDGTFRFFAQRLVFQIIAQRYETKFIIIEIVSQKIIERLNKRAEIESHLAIVPENQFEANNHEKVIQIRNDHSLDELQQHAIKFARKLFPKV